MSTRYNTGNPIESTDVRDMSDNAKNFDDFANSKSNEFTDRFGVERKTIHGMNSQFDSHILNMGFTRVGTFAAGATLTNPRQTLLWDIADGGDGHEYGWSGAFPKVVPPLGTPNTTGGVSAGAWVDRSDVALRSELSSPSGPIDFARKGLRDIISVKDFPFNAKGDGVTDDSAAIQAAFTFAGSMGLEVYFPSGVYVINSTCVLPIQSISVHGAWANTIIKGAASPLFTFPTVIGKVHNISRISFEYNNVAINATKIWSAAGVEPSCIVSECRFKSMAANSKAITLSGIWAARIYGNSFIGTGKTANETAISIVTGDNMDTSVMNTDIQNNSSVFIAYPVRYNGRTITTGGRVEGLTILGNKFVAGKSGVILAQTLATAINSNMCSDFEYGVDLYGDFAFTISGNPDLSGSIACVRLNELTDSIMERGVVTGNNISIAQAGGGILMNAPSGGLLRSIAISGNVIGRSATGTKAVYGVKLVGNNLSNIAITGNAFMYITTAVDRGTDVNKNSINSNTYNLVDNTGVSSPHNTPFTASIVETLVGGTSHTLTVPLPPGAASGAPFFASCVVASTVGGSPILCSYLYGLSTKDRVVFNIIRADGTALPSSGVRFAVAALPF